MRTKALGIGIAGLLAALLSSTVAAAAPSWQPAQTLDLVRGVPRPDVGISAAGSSTVVFSSADTTFDEMRPWIAVRPSTGGFTVKSAKPGGQVDAHVAVAPNGATAIAAVARGRIYVTLYPAPGAAGAPGVEGTDGRATPIDVGGLAIDGLQLAVDGAGSATVVWSSPGLGEVGDPPTQIYTATAGPSALGPAQTLGAPGRCRPDLDVNLRGDAVVTRNCSGQPDDFFYRPAGDVVFGASEEPFGGGEPSAGDGRVGATVDGAGSVHAFQALYADDVKGYHLSRVSYAVRPRSGLFGPPEQLGFASPLSFDLEAQEDGDVIAAWPGGYAFRPPGGPFGPVRAVTGMGYTGLDLVTSPNGPALLSWRDQFGLGSARTEQVAASVIGPDGASPPSRLGLPGVFGGSLWSPVSFAINDSGQAIAAWEQRCSREGASAVMAAALAEGSTGNLPPCQDRVAPRVLVRPKRARLDGQRLRVRVGCDESCRLGVGVRILRKGRGRPLATARLRKASVAAGRYRTIVIRLRRAEAAAVRRARAARRRVTVRLALSVRDSYENGAVRRVAVPLRR